MSSNEKCVFHDRKIIKTCRHTKARELYQTKQGNKDIDTAVECLMDIGCQTWHLL